MTAVRHERSVCQHRWVSRGVLVSLVVGAALLSSAAAGFGEPGSRALAASAIDLHKVGWGSVTLPGSVCGASEPIRLHHGSAFITPVPARFSGDSFPGRRGVTVDSPPDGVVFGDLERSGRDYAGLAVNCNNGGGTPTACSSTHGSSSAGVEEGCRWSAP